MEQSEVKEFLVELNQTPELLGRIVVTPLAKKYLVEVDLIFKDGRKIYASLGREICDGQLQEAVDSGRQLLAFRLTPSSRE